MEESRTDEDLHDAAEIEPRAAAPTTESVATGAMEINLGDFTRTQGLMKSLRLMLNGQVVISVEEIASGVSEAGRKFKLGEIEEANQDVTRLYAAFGQRTNQWESQARNLEQQMKMQAAKNPKSISINKFNQMKSEQTAVRTRIRTAEVQFRRLHQGLDQAFTNLQRQAVAAKLDQTTEPAAETNADLPADFLSRFKAAPVADRPAIVQAFFKTETVMKVSVSRGEKSGYDIKFDPLPPLHRLYFLATTAQVVRLQQLGSSVLLQHVDNGAIAEIKLVEFVKHIQNGVWLLKSRSA